MTQIPKTREDWIDGLRIMAGLSMVGLHATVDVHGNPFPQADADARLPAMVLRMLFYTARTEVFILLSLFLLILSLDRRPRGYRTTLSEHVRRLLPPFLFWTLFYSVFNLMKASHFGYASAVWNELANPASWIGYLFLGDVKYHMHFLPTLLGVLVAYPMFVIAIRYPILGLGLIGFIYLRWQLGQWAYSQFWDHALLPFVVRTIKIISYLGYGLAAGALVGIWLNHRQAIRTCAFKLPLLLAIAVLLIAKFDAIKDVIETGRWTYNHQFGFWADFLMPILLFAGAMSLARSHWPKTLTQLAPLSFGLYLCHPIFMDLAEIALPNDLSPISQIAFKLSIVVPATFGAVWLLSRTRAFAWTVGLGPLPALGSRLTAHLRKESQC